MIRTLKRLRNKMQEEVVEASTLRRSNPNSALVLSVASTGDCIRISPIGTRRALYVCSQMRFIDFANKTAENYSSNANRITQRRIT